MYFGYLRLKINNAKPHDFFTRIPVGGASTEEPHGDGAFGCWESFWETRCDCGWRGRLSHAPLEALGIQQVSTLLLQLLLENKQRPVGASYCQVASNFCHFSLKGIERWIIFISFLGCLKWFAIRKRTNAAEKLVKYWFFMRNRSGSPSKNIISRCQKEHASYREMSVTLFFFFCSLVESKRPQWRTARLFPRSGSSNMWAQMDPSHGNTAESRLIYRPPWLFRERKNQNRSKCKWRFFGTEKGLTKAHRLL